MKINIFLLGVVILSVLIWTVFDNYVRDDSKIIQIAFIGPMSGEGSTAGRIMTNAIQLYLEKVNKRDELKGKRIELKIYDDKNDCQAKAKTEALKIVEENQALAVIGHWYSSCSITGGKIYKKYAIPAITPGSVKKEVTEGNKWYFRNIYNASASGQFLAHYVKKVFGLNQVTIIHDDSGYGSYLAEVFEQAARKLNMEIKYNWAYKTKDKEKEAHFKQIIHQIKQSGKEAGAILLAVQASEGVKLVQSIKDKRIDNFIISGSGFSEKTFVDGFNIYPKEKVNPGYYTNDIYVATPLIFDTANEKAQQFKDEYQERYPNDERPDWSAAYAYDTAMVLIEAIKKAEIDGNQESLQEDRQKIRDVLAGFTNIHDAVEGTTGFNYFDKNRDSQKPVAIGVYKNKNLVSALTQFQVMRNPNEIADLDKAISEKRVLKIGDKYMYKTNVVYTGIKINEISDINFKDLTFTLDFHLWFRSHSSSYYPQDIEFPNAIAPEWHYEINDQKKEGLFKNTVPQIRQTISEQLEKPFDEKTTGEDQIAYRVYRIKSRFRADVSSKYYAYKQHILGIRFYHKTLTRNNLIYVTDILGMGQAQDMSKQQDTESSKKTQDNHVLSHALGWSIEQPRFFQDVAKKYSLGDPDYLNVQGGTIEYSRFNANILLKKIDFTPRGRIGYQYASSLLVFSSISILLFNIFSKKFRKWSKWTWFFQVIFAFLLLLSGEIILLDWMTENIDSYNMGFIIKIFDILWWLIPAFLINLASERFIWTPVEERTGRLIPNIVRLFLAFIIYFMAVVGIIAFVYERQLTSILATSGVIAMIIGLAIQINISNIFSGIAINIERPFRIGDWVKIGSFDEGEIVDITWRTTRLKTRADCILSIPNSMASESPILNFCFPDDVYWLWPTVYIHPMHPPARVKKILLDALLSADKVLKEPAPVVLFTSINEWAASYWIAFCADDYANKNFILEDVWTRVWFHLNRAGITPAVQRQEIHLFKGVKERGGEEAAKPITLLQEIDIFKPFSEEAKIDLSKRMSGHRFNASDIIVQQGDAGDSLFIIVEGVVGVYVRASDGKSKEVARLGAGNFFGEMALLTGEDRTATVIALVDTYLFELTKADIRPLMAKQPEVSELVSKVLTQRQMVTRRQMHVEHDVEVEKDAVYKRFLNRIEQFFGLKNEQ
ncbi:ABC transporter substrate-binding protein [Candidatus Parabeggiatoa sp. HSG14]|uniref:ABC transporter substrate-binding protein n=1 Tax=Candidatus Parabeggiatoa sp. HSG14 TaxID=3055593 RepID=UPI0025A91334|nr:ABC transporter substrate-binding protein [Thiotrichales bacterium HSG14]